MLFLSSLICQLSLVMTCKNTTHKKMADWKQTFHIDGAYDVNSSHPQCLCKLVVYTSECICPTNIYWDPNLSHVSGIQDKVPVLTPERSPRFQGKLIPGDERWVAFTSKVSPLENGRKGIPGKRGQCVEGGSVVCLCDQFVVHGGDWWESSLEHDTEICKAAWEIQL